jgi:hypothetical protein
MGMRVAPPTMITASRGVGPLAVASWVARITEGPLAGLDRPLHPRRSEGFELGRVNATLVEHVVGLDAYVACFLGTQLALGALSGES